MSIVFKNPKTRNLNSNKEFHFRWKGNNTKCWISSTSMVHWNLDEFDNNILNVYNIVFEKVFTFRLSDVKPNDKSFVNLLCYIITSLTPYVVLSTDRKYAIKPDRTIGSDGSVSLINTLIPLDNIVEFYDDQLTYYAPQISHNICVESNLTAELLLNKVFV
jgi:hypothetical protein